VVCLCSVPVVRAAATAALFFLAPAPLRQAGLDFCRFQSAVEQAAPVGRFKDLQAEVP